MAHNHKVGGSKPPFVMKGEGWHVKVLETVGRANILYKLLDSLMVKQAHYSVKVVGSIPAPIIFI